MGHTNEWQGYGVYGARFDSGGPDWGLGGFFWMTLDIPEGFIICPMKKLKRIFSQLLMLLKS